MPSAMYTPPPPSTAIDLGSRNGTVLAGLSLSKRSVPAMVVIVYGCARQFTANVASDMRIVRNRCVGILDLPELLYAIPPG